jgi:hypothetical protein
VSLGRLILRPAARLAAVHAASQYRYFLRAAHHARAAQERLLRRLTETHARTRFGREHGLAAVRTCDDFRRAVPIRDYEQLRPYLQAVYEGDVEAMFPRGTPILMFAVTSGATGRPKHIPVTRQTLNDYRRGWNVFGYKLLCDHPDAWLRPILQVSSPAIEGYSPTGIPCGAISGMLGLTQKRIVRRMYVAPPSVTAIADPQAKYYTLMRLAMPRDVALISTANPSTIIKLLTTAQRHIEELLRDLRDGTLTPPGEMTPNLAKGLPLGRHPDLVRRIEQGIARDGLLRASHFWRLSVLTHWTGGTLGLYLPQVRRLTEGVPIRDVGLLASEGRFSVPFVDGTASGAADITSSYFEFIPAEDEGASRPVAFGMHELEAGREYFLVLTNSSGLWRYNIQDRVRVTGWMGQTPLIEFLSKGAHTASITGEKLTENQIVEAVARASAALGLEIQHFVAQGHFADLPYYHLTAQIQSDRLDQLAAAVDAALQKLNVEYAAKRHSGRLGPVRVSPAQDDLLARAEREFLNRRGPRLEQYKPRYLLTDVATDAPQA